MVHRIAILALLISATPADARQRDPWEWDGYLSIHDSGTDVVFTGHVTPGASYTLRDTRDRHVVIAPRTITAAPERLAVCFVIQGDAAWLGATRDELAAMLDALHLEQQLRGGGDTCIVTYSAGHVTLELPMSPPAKLHGSVLPSRDAIRGRMPGDLALALAVAANQLETVRFESGLVVVIGDGTSTLTDGFDLDRTMSLLISARAATRRLVYDPGPPGEYVGPIHLDTIADAAGPITAAVQSNVDVTELRFPGTPLTWDGQLHELFVKSNTGDGDPIALDLFADDDEPSYGWIIALAAGALLALGVVLAHRRTAVTLRA